MVIHIMRRDAPQLSFLTLNLMSWATTKKEKVRSKKNFKTVKW